MGLFFSHNKALACSSTRTASTLGCHFLSHRAVFVLSCWFCWQPARGHIMAVITARHSLLLRHHPMWVSEHQSPPLKHSTPHTPSWRGGFWGFEPFPRLFPHVHSQEPRIWIPPQKLPKLHSNILKSPRWHLPSRVTNQAQRRRILQKMRL